MKNLYLMLAVLILPTAIFAQTISPITGVFAVCDSNSTVLNESTPGGVWSSSDPTIAPVYAVSGAPLTGYVFGLSAGVATISYTVGAVSVTATVTVNPNPAPITGVSSICQGATTTFTDITSGGTWSSDHTGIATIDVYTGVTTTYLSAISPGVTFIWYTLPTGCDAPQELIVDPMPMPIWTPSANTVCIGSVITENEDVPGGFWISSNVAVTTINAVTGIAVGVSPGTATITYSLGGSCTVTTALTVTAASCSGTPVAGTISASALSLCIGSSLTLTVPGASAGCGIGYQWQYSPDGTSWSDFSGAIASLFSDTVLVSQYYRCKVTCLSSGLFAYSASLFISAHTGIDSHYVISVPDTFCNGPDFYISACGISSSFNVTTWYGDGTFDNRPLTASGVCHADIFHAYTAPGNYFVKQVLYSGAIPQDSVTFSYEYSFCRTLPVKFYFDANSDCIFDSGDIALLLPVRVEIDSNGILVDTVSAISGLYLKTTGPQGTVYAFRVVSTPIGLHLTCPSTAVLYDTIQSFVNDYHEKYFGLNCASGAFFDLAESVTTRTGRHMQTGTIVVDNSFCAPESATVTLTFSPQYLFSSSIPSPTIVGNVATWNLGAVSSSSPVPLLISYTLSVPTPDIMSTWLIPGDTVNSSLVTAPVIGDLDTTNNTIIWSDTVKSSYDPNEMSVMPKGNILACTKLRYTVNFENTGNDIAHNISIMDTLSDDLDPRSLNIEIASSAMNIAMLNDGVHNIVKFDFPNINLLDSSHHNQCDGMVIFNIKTRSGLHTGTVIPNYAGIFFDDNPAVMTDTAVNEIGLPAITGTGSVCLGSVITLATPAGFRGGTWSSSSTAIAAIGSSSGIITGVSASPAVITYTVINSCGATSTTKPIIVNPLPTPYPVTGGGGYCISGPGVHIGMDSSNIGTDYFLHIGSIAVGTYDGTGAILDFGLQTFPGTYSVVATNISTTCSRNMPDSAVVYTISRVASSVSIVAGPGETVCAGEPVTFTPVPVYGGATPAYVWNVDGTDAGTGGTYTFLPADGDVVTLTLTSSALCATPETTSNSLRMAVESPLAPSFSIAASPGTSIGIGQEVTLTAGITGGGATNIYQWLLNGTSISGATAAAYTSNTLSDRDSVSCIITTGNLCGNITSAQSVVFSVGNVGIKPIGSDKQLSIFPNPNKGGFTITGSLGTSDEEATVTITDMIGQVTYKNTIMAVNGNLNEQIQLSNSVAKGMYMLNLRSGVQNKVFHFVIE